jgi:hypothetical protein
MTYTITTTSENMRIIGGALAELPFRIAAPVISDLQRQVSEQDAARGAMPPAPEAFPPA